MLALLPGVAGAATSPALNNGGGFGESNVELRGLDAKRTLVLVDGRRVGIVGGPGSSGAVDINQIPVNIIDHVDVLKEGAGAIYGSDAIAGVVNFVTKKNVNDLTINGEYGRTTHGDGPHQAVSVMWGGSTDKFDFVISGNYNKQKAVYAGARDFSKDALYLYSGSSGRFVSHAGSSRVPNAARRCRGLPLRTLVGCSNETRTARPTVRRPPTTVFAPLQLPAIQFVATPQERGALFASSTYHITDDLDFYVEI